MKIRSKKHPSRRGATIILMLALLTIVFIFVAFAIDIGRIQLAQLKLQTAADFASRAGAEAMSRGLADNQNDLEALETAIRNEADMLMRENSLFGAPVAFDSNAQITFGFSNSTEDEQVYQPLGNGGGNGNGNGNAGGNGNGNAGGNGNGEDNRNGNAQLHGNGKKKFRFMPSGNGKLTLESNSINVNPDISQFPLAFGTFLGRDSVALSASSTAKIQDRDIVVVLDRSGSMLDHDAGSIAIGEYNANLLEVEDALYGENDPEYSDADSRHTEFENNGHFKFIAYASAQTCNVEISRNN